MTRGEFDQLVERYRRGECSPQELAFVEQWMKTNADVNINKELPFDDEKQLRREEQAIWNDIQRSAGLLPKRTIGVTRTQTYFLAAVGVVALLAIGVMLFPPPVRQSQPSSFANETAAVNGLETTNSSGIHQRILLPDSSVVVLAQGASIAVDKDYGASTRSVKLKGEAAFTVKPDAKVPFLVFVGDLVTEVLGTSFTIKPENTSGIIEVSVTTGKVSVYSNIKDANQRRRGVIVTSNQKAVYDTENKSIRQDLVDFPKLVDQRTPRSIFNFDDVPVEYVLSTLRRSYGMDIVVSNTELNDCIFTGDLSGFDLFKQLDYVCDIIGMTYEVRGTTIFLSGIGCRDAL